MNNEVILDTDGKKFEESGGLIKPLNYEQSVEEKTSTPPSQNDIGLNQFQESLYPTNVNNLQPGEVAPSLVVAKEKNQEEVHTAQIIGKKNAEEFNNFLKTGESNRKSFSVDENNPWVKKYQEQQEEKKALNPVSSSGQDFFDRKDEIEQSVDQNTVTESVEQSTMVKQETRKEMDQMSQNLKNQAQTVAEMKAKNPKYEETKIDPVEAQNNFLKGLREEIPDNGQTENPESSEAKVQKLSEEVNELKIKLEKMHDLEIKLDALSALLSKLQLQDTVPATQIDGEEPVTTVQEPQPVVENTPQINNATFVNVNQQSPVAESTNHQVIDAQLDETPENTQPVSSPAFTGATQQSSGQQAPTPEQFAAAMAELRQLKGENTPEQRSAALGSEISKLDEKAHTEGLTNEEKSRYYDLLKEKEFVDAALNKIETESTKKRERKERIIKIVAGVAGAGLALATPAVGVAAIVAVTLGGKFVGDGIKKVSNNLRSKSTSLKYESRQGKTIAELNEIDKKIKRKEWWANRLGEASAVVIGGSIGYGLGSTFQNIFGWGTGSAGTVTNTPSDLPGQASVSHAPTTGQGSIELPQGVGGSGIETQGQGVLVDGGRVNLPGSAWNGNLAQGPAQDILQGGALNHSNYNGGIHEMAAHTLEDALVKNGVTRPELMENLNTSQVHQLLNRYLEATRGGNVNPDLAQMLNSVKPGVAETLLK